MTDMLEDLKRINSQIETIDKAIAREQELIETLERKRKDLDREEGAPDALREQLEQNKRKLRDLEYEEKDVRSRKTDLEAVYHEGRISELDVELKKLSARREAIRDTLIPHLEERVAGLREESDELDRLILRISGKIKHFSES